MTLATAMKQTLLARGLTTAEVAQRLAGEQDRATFYRLVNGTTQEPRLGALVRLRMAMDTAPSELLELAGVWLPDDLRLCGAFGRVRTLPEAVQQRVVPLVEAVAMAWPPGGNEQSADADDTQG